MIAKKNEWLQKIEGREGGGGGRGESASDSLYVTVTNNKQINKLDLPMRLVLRLMGGYNG